MAIFMHVMARRGYRQQIQHHDIPNSAADRIMLQNPAQDCGLINCIRRFKKWEVDLTF
jgi:hypothetical protein